jgi:LCP family protein required for cell wall assembly
MHARPEADSPRADGRRSKKSSAKRFKTSHKVLIGIAGVLVVAIASICIYIAVFLAGLQSNISLSQLQLDQLNDELVAPATPQDPFYVLIVGSDSRDETNAGAGRSDTIMLTRIDPTSKQVTIVSIPRDTEIQLDGYGTQKINAAFAYGGPAGIVKEASELTGANISHFVELDFNGVINLVDTVGGITVNLPVDVELDGVFLPAGVNELDGAKALVVSRCRSFPLGDFQRVVNQRLLVQAVAKKILDADITRVPELVEQLSRCVVTDISVTDAIGLLMTLRGMNPDDMYMATIPAHTSYHDETSFVAAEQPALSQMMDRVNQGLPPIDPNLPPEEKSQTQTAVVE